MVVKNLFHNLANLFILTSGFLSITYDVSDEYDLNLHQGF